MIILMTLVNISSTILIQIKKSFNCFANANTYNDVGKDTIDDANKILSTPIY